MTAFLKAPDVPWMGPWSSMSRKKLGELRVLTLGATHGCSSKVMAALSFGLRVKRAATWNPRGTHFYRIRPLQDHLAIALQPQAYSKQYETEDLINISESGLGILPYVMLEDKEKLMCVLFMLEIFLPANEEIMHGIGGL